MEAIPIIIFWSIATWALFQPRHVLIYFLFGSMPFGSFAAIPTSITGGLTLTPLPIVTLLLIAKELGNPAGLRNAVADALSSSRLLLLFLFWIVAGVATTFMPRLFAGSVEIVPVRSDVAVETAMLMPTTQNISQFIYITVSVLAVFAFARSVIAPQLRRHILPALCMGASLMILTGVLDFASQYMPLDAVLEMFRTASYSLLTTDEVLGGKRIVGLMPEASAFGSVALTFLVAIYFFRRTAPPGFLYSRICPFLIAVLTLIVWMSTSSAAYLGLGVFGVVAFTEWCWRAFFVKSNIYLRRGVLGEFYFGAIVIAGLLLLFIASPRTFAPLQEMLDVMVFQKTNSSSFEERGMWTRVSWEALKATGGLGVGMGGTRASNFAVALISSAGVLGAMLFFAFVAQCMFVRRPTKGDFEGAAFMSALRWAFIPPFVTSLTIGTTPDFGTFNAFLFGLAIALSLRRFERPIGSLRRSRQQRVINAETGSAALIKQASGAS